MATTGRALSLALLGQLALGQLCGLGLDRAWVCCTGGSIALNLFGHHCHWCSKKTQTSPVPGAADSLWQVHCPTKAIVHMALCLASERVLDCVSSSVLGGRRRMNQKRGPGACPSWTQTSFLCCRCFAWVSLSVPWLRILRFRQGELQSEWRLSTKIWSQWSWPLR